VDEAMRRVNETDSGYSSKHVVGAHLIYPGTYNHPLMHRQALLLADVLLGQDR